MKLFKLLVPFVVLINSVCVPLRAETDSSRIIKKRFYPMIAVIGVSYTGAMIGLNELWYKNEPRTSFHFFNDNHEWEQMDKLGHGMTAFHESRLGVDLLKWSGVPERKAIWYGSLAGIIFQSPIELFDGYSAAYGASAGDLVANASGSLLVLGQYLLWNELRMQMKFSFHQTKFAALRPNVLGDNVVQQTFKDYNGQTYWLSFNIHSFLREESRFPKWLNVSVGYGAQNMVSAERHKNIAMGYDTYRQVYFSFDIDMEKIKTRSKFLRKFFYGFNMIKIPAPALEINKHGVRFHPLYF